MTNHIFSKQEVIELLSQLREIRAEYPPELLAARRRIYLSLGAQHAVTRITVNIRRKLFVSSIVHEPGSTVIKALIIVFVAFLVAFVLYSITTGNVDFGWLTVMLSR